LVRRKEMRWRTVEGRRAFNWRAVARDDGLSLALQTAASLSFSLKTCAAATWRGIAATLLAPVRSPPLSQPEEVIAGRPGSAV
jgi:hypothetical protein